MNRADLVDYREERDEGPYYVARERCYICGKIVVGIMPERVNPNRLECSRCHGMTSQVVRYYGHHGKRYVKHRQDIRP